MKITKTHSTGSLRIPMLTTSPGVTLDPGCMKIAGATGSEAKLGLGNRLS